MANQKRRTTLAKLNRETRLRERRDEKEARKAARKLDGEDARATNRERWPDPVDDVASEPQR